MYFKTYINDLMSWWWTGRPGVLRFMGSQRVGHDWATNLIWSDLMYHFHGLLRWLSGKESAYNAGDPGLIPALGRSLGEGNGYPLQYSCLENPMDRGTWQATVHGVTKSWTWLSNWTTVTYHFHIILRFLRLSIYGYKKSCFSICLAFF